MADPTCGRQEAARIHAELAEESAHENRTIDADGRCGGGIDRLR